MIARWLTAANLVTALRIALTPLVIGFIVNGQPRAGAAWFALAAFTDFLDGWLARARHATSAVGLYLDPIADKILLSGVFIALALEGGIPAWYLILVLGRDVALLAASGIAMRVSSYQDYTPTVWGKLSTLLQILAAVVVMASNAEGTGAWRAAAEGTVLCSGLATAWSTIHYTWRGVMYFVRPREIDG